MATQICLWVEVAGCPTICQHCWAQGVPYPTMPLADIAWVLEQAYAACTTAGLIFSAYPFHEVAAHPEASAVLRLFSAFPGDPSLDEGRPMWEPLSTTGVPLALRPDWAEVLATCRELGTTVVWPAVHGVGETHDRMVRRAGAYQETLLAIERVRSVGMEVGCNVFLTRENVAQFDALVADLLARGVMQLAVEPAGYLPTARSRRYEALRPVLADLLPLIEPVRALPGPCFGQSIWADLAAYTEAAYVRRALEGAWPAPPESRGEELELVCRPNLDLHWAIPGRYRRRFGNLRRDDAQEVLRTAMTHNGGSSDDALWFTRDPLPEVPDLAERYGDPEGDRVHFSPESVRYRWLDLAGRRPRAG
ncbi:MAG TPA: radical SAM protein [Chloroflexota bacterium]|nr:radical SAM protein [Chloroflexota bacterium]